MNARQVVNAINSKTIEFEKNMADISNWPKVMEVYQPQFRDLARLAAAPEGGIPPQDARDLQDAALIAGDIGDQSPKHIASLLDRVRVYNRTRGGNALPAAIPQSGGAILKVMAVVGTGLGLLYLAAKVLSR